MNNSFGTHEFMDLVEQLGTEASITGNVGSGTPQEVMEWVEYMTSDAVSPMANLRRQNGQDQPWRVAFFSIGDEPWGCMMSVAGRRAKDGGPVASLLHAAHRQLGSEGLGHRFRRGPVVRGMQRTLRRDELITRHAEIMSKSEADMTSGSTGRPGADKKVGLVVDECGTWYDAEKGTLAHEHQPRAGGGPQRDPRRARRRSVTGRVLTAPAMTAHNTFEAPNAVQPAGFDGARLQGGTLEVRLPAKSVVVLALK